MQRTISVVNLSSIERNARLLKGMAKGKFYAVVKADAYGHGAVEVSKRLLPVADGFCVAIVDEGVELRAAGISAPVLVLTPPMDEDDALRMSAYNLTATVVDERTAALSKGLSVHVGVNTGMNRYGCPPGELEKLLPLLEECTVMGVYSHIYAPQLKEDREEQLKIFSSCAKLVKAAYPEAVVHLSATAGTLLGGKYLFDGVRCGIGLYGYTPAGFSCKGLEPALKVYARRVQTFSPPVGGGVGYAKSSRGYKTLSSYRAGYGDGFFRTLPLGEGNLCMDAFVSEEQKDSLCIFLNADEYAERGNTISYEVLCAVTKRSQIIYEG